MQNKLHYKTVTPALKETLNVLMGNPIFAQFTLVGGTNLSLRYGYRQSVDIDLFSDADYGSINFSRIEEWFKANYPYCIGNDDSQIVAMGRSYFVGKTKEDAIKVDLFYTDPFIRSVETIDGIRMAHTDDIVAMKVEVVSRKARKKDFWDLHFLLDSYDITQMIELYRERYPWGHDSNVILANFADFDKADNDPDPDCYHGKVWELVKLDFYELVK